MRKDPLVALLRRPALSDEIERERARRSLREFVRQGWHVIEPATVFVPGIHIDAICDHLQAISMGQIRNLLINVPPRHMKSLLVCVFWPAWEWIQWPERRFLYSSYASIVSVRDSVKCRRLIESPWYQRRWGDVFALTGDQNAKTRFDNSRSGYRLATSVGGAVTGEGGDRIVCDDPHKVDEAESDKIRQAAIEWWDVAMSTRLNDPKTSAKVVVMQRCHQRDLSGHLQEQGGWEHLCLPAEYEGSRKATSIGFSDPRIEPGELLWPERFGKKEIAELKVSLGSYGAAGQLQQRPSPAGGGLIKPHWFKFWQPSCANLPPVMVPWPDGTQRAIIAHIIDKVDERAQTWDCSFKGLDTSDYVVGQIWGRMGSSFLLLDQVRGKMDFPATVKTIREKHRYWWPYSGILIEDKANGSAVIQMLTHEIAGILPVNPEGGKVTRAQGISPLIEAGNVYLPHPSYMPWVTDFLEECASFPNGAHDDQVDAMTQMLLRWHQPVEQTTIIPFSDLAEAYARNREESPWVHISPF